MSDRRPEKPRYETCPECDGFGQGPHHGTCRFCLGSGVDLVAAVRRGVESGEIEGEVVKRMCVEHRAWLANSDPSTVCRIYSYVRLYRGRPSPCEIVERLVIDPVSDGGSEQ